MEVKNVVTNLSSYPWGAITAEPRGHGAMQVRDARARAEGEQLDPHPLRPFSRPMCVMENARRCSITLGAKRAVEPLVGYLEELAGCYRRRRRVA